MFPHSLAPTYVTAFYSTRLSSTRYFVRAILGYSFWEGCCFLKKHLGAFLLACYCISLAKRMQKKKSSLDYPPLLFEKKNFFRLPPPLIGD